MSSEAVTREAAPPSRASPRSFLAWAILPALVYLLFVAAQLAVDTFLGDATAWHQFRYESRAALLRLLLADGLKALPLLYGVAGLALLGVLLLRSQRLSVPSKLIAVATALLGVFMLAALGRAPAPLPELPPAEARSPEPAPGALRGEDHVWIIGGGPTPDSSERQIEANVNWVIGALRRLRPAAHLHVYYGKGSSPGNDIRHWRRPEESAAALQPLARVFGQHHANGNEYRANNVPHVAGPTTAPSLAARLADDFARLKPGDRALLIYNGHGLQDEDDFAGNTLRLWDNTTLSVRELDALMQHIHPAVPLRFMFTQCYSGGFLRLIRPGAADVAHLGKANRCGFAAESETRMSEGCSATLEIGDYRDYTTFFFAALAGQTRSGQAIPAQADRNRDGAVSLFEAHLHVLEAAHNADLPRSSSESYLERWQPGYLRWLTSGEAPDNSFGEIAANIGRQLDLPAENPMLRRELERRRAALAEQNKTLLDEQRQLMAAVEVQQKQFRQALASRWPEALHPYTAGHVRFLNEDAAAAQAFIVSRPDYSALVQRQDRLGLIELERVALDRDATRLDLVLRLRRMARLLDQFERFATPRERLEYAKLQDCEGQPL